MRENDDAESGRDEAVPPSRPRIAMEPPEPSIRDLRGFLKFVDTGDRAAAAYHLGKDRTGISRAVKRMNSFYGHVIVSNHHGHLRTTERGLEVAAAVRKALHHLDCARDRGKSCAVTRIGFSPIARLPLAQALQQLRKKSGDDFSVKIREATVSSYKRMLGAHELDLALGFDLSMHPNEKYGFKRYKIASYPLEIFLPSKFRHYDGSITEVISSLRRCYIVPSLHPAFFEAGTNWLARMHGVEPPDCTAGECQTGSEIMTMIGGGRWYSVLPSMYRNMAGPDVVARPMPGSDYQAKFCAYYWLELEEVLNPLLEELVQACSDRMP
jgi:DNA-binding transcriptional LysR family regulator